MASSRSPSIKKGSRQDRKVSERAVGTLGAAPSRRARFSDIFLPQTRQGRLWLLGILVLAFALRAYELLSLLPVQLDEAIYLRWAEIIDHQGQWFISLLDGKEPLTYWILALLRKAVGGDPLLEARAVSVAAGVLSALGVFAVGRRAGGDLTGLLASGLYACLPYALVYDRLAYTEAVANCFGIAIVLTSLVAFDGERGEGPPDSRRGLGPGLALGLGLFTKQTLFLLAFFPALAALRWGWKDKRRVAADLAWVYGIAALFVAFSLVMRPEAPTLESHNALVHSTRFFVQPQELLSDPFKVAPSNLRKLGGFISAYVTWPAAFGALVSLAYLAWRRARGVWIPAAASLAPLAVQVFVLELMYPSRYPFPHFWPLLVLAGWAVADAANRYGGSLQGALRPAAAAVLSLVLAGPVVYRSVGILRTPGEYLYAEDAKNFLGGGAHAGFGVREAASYLLEESRQGAFVLLTDPIWGPPADALFAYLNERRGIRVYEAWWTQLSGGHVILPPGQAQVLKSHYERVEAGTVDFSNISRVFYVTDTNFYPRAAVQVRQPGAQLVASFPKTGGQSLDVYRLR